MISSTKVDSSNGCHTKEVSSGDEVIRLTKTRIMGDGPLVTVTSLSKQGGVRPPTSLIQGRLINYIAVGVRRTQ